MLATLSRFVLPPHKMKQEAQSKSVGTGDGSTLTVELDQLDAVMEYLGRINRQPLKDIIWLRTGTVLKVTDEQYETWRFTGMNNRDFGLMVVEGDQSNTVHEPRSP